MCSCTFLIRLLKAILRERRIWLDNSLIYCPTSSILLHCEKIYTGSEKGERSAVWLYVIGICYPYKPHFLTFATPQYCTILLDNESGIFALMLCQPTDTVCSTVSELICPWPFACPTSVTGSPVDFPTTGRQDLGWIAFWGTPGFVLGSPGKSCSSNVNPFCHPLDETPFWTAREK